MPEILNFQNVNVAIFLIIYTEHFNAFANMTSVSVLGLPTTGRSMCLYTTNQNEVKFHTCRTMFIVSSLVYNQKINHIYFINIYIYIYLAALLSFYIFKSWRTGCHCAEYWIYWKYSAKSFVCGQLWNLDLFSLSWMLYPQPLVLFSLYVY